MYFGILLSSSIVTTLSLLYLFYRKRFCFLKPSILFIASFNIFLQWSAVIYYQEVDAILSLFLTDFIMLFSFFPLIVLAVSANLFLKSAKYLHARIDSPAFFTKELQLFLFFSALAGAAIYFYYVPVSQSGLVSILRGDDALTNARLRETSLKLLPGHIRYLHTFSTKVMCVALVLTSVNQFMLYRKCAGKRWIILGKAIFLTIFAILFSGISGARGMGASVLIAILAFMFYRSAMRLKIKVAVICVVSIIALPLLLQYLRSDSQSSMAAVNTIVERIFLYRLSAGIYTIHSAEIYGYWGIAAIPKLAYIFSIEPVNVANVVIKMIFVGSPIKTGLANASFIMTYYAYFGLLALFLCVFLTLLLDLIPWFVRLLIKPRLYCYAAVAYTMPMYALTSVDYTTVFLSSGVMLWLVLLMVIPKRLLRTGPVQYRKISKINYCQIDKCSPMDRMTAL